MPADWQRYGRGAGPIRNKQIVESADLVIAFWDGKSNGTRSALAHAERAGVPVEFHHADQTVAEWRATLPTGLRLKGPAGHHAIGPVYEYQSFSTP